VTHHETAIQNPIATDYAEWTKWTNICVLMQIHHLLMQCTITIFNLGAHFTFSYIRYYKEYILSSEVLTEMNAFIMSSHM
jgi:hypothetical protein